MRVALVHDWLTGMRGGERVLEALLELYPAAEIFTLFHFPGTVSPAIEARPIHTSFLQRAPSLRRRYRAYLPLFPAAVESLDVRGFDLVISSSHCVAKSVRPRGAPHLCYCHTPVRYVWERGGDYLDRRLELLSAPAVAAFRAWDRRSAARVDAFVANSENVRGRIRRSYDRDAAVVYPPIALGRFQRPRGPEDFYLVLGALVPYKRVDLAIRACALTGRRLVVAGDGPELDRLRRIAGPDVAFLGRVGDDQAEDLLSRCRALLFPGLEDFGMTVVEAQAAGAPVVALAAGGALETLCGPLVSPRGVGRRVGTGRAATGVFFPEQTAAHLAAAMLQLERMEFDERSLRASAGRFHPSRFEIGLRAQVERLLGRAAARVGVPATAGARA